MRQYIDTSGNPVNLSAKNDTTTHVMFLKGNFKGFASIGGYFEV